MLFAATQLLLASRDGHPSKVAPLLVGLSRATDGCLTEGNSAPKFLRVNSITLQNILSIRKRKQEKKVMVWKNNDMQISFASTFNEYLHTLCRPDRNIQSIHYILNDFQFLLSGSCAAVSFDFSIGYKVAGMLLQVASDHREQNHEVEGHVILRRGREKVAELFKELQSKLLAVHGSPFIGRVWKGIFFIPCPVQLEAFYM